MGTRVLFERITRKESPSPVWKVWFLPMNRNKRADYAEGDMSYLPGTFSEGELSAFLSGYDAGKEERG